MDDAIAAIQSRIKSETAFSVGVGHPRSLRTQIVIWPWRIARLPQARNPIPPNLSPTGLVQPVPQLFAVDILFLSKREIDSLTRVAKIIEDNPLINIGDKRYHLVEQSLAPELQVAIFSSASLSLQPVLNYTISNINVVSDALTDNAPPILEKGRVVAK
ncbi:hypothetical protein LG198_05525 [Methylobacillus arboreus]|uniref:hypothetical protein n=1 Tax=Methylobacillus arboreus TaxID=755170 RepID=UPI001E5B542E|nr:hypothetical protein [Methylobacillus arboreus]MCB5190182.1 hypothetical protein [Methylobacillus arboreus]